MSDGVFWVAFDPDPARCGPRGWGERLPSSGDFILRHCPGYRVEALDHDEWRALMDSDEPSRWIAERFGLRYEKFIEPEGGAMPNVVEILAEPRACGFDQPCAFGHRVEEHAVYCHNEQWVDAPRKCRRTWYTGGKRRDEDCPGFEPNPRSVGGRDGG